MTEESCAECGAAETMAFEVAYGLYRGPLVHSIRRRATALGLSERDVDVEALVQDTFEDALRVWDTIKIPRAWLYTVARRRLSRCVPEAMRRAHGEPSDHAEQGSFGWTTLTPGTSVTDVVAAREITALIQRMPQQRRQEVAYLRFLEGWDFNEIAEQLGCCPATARVHAHNARNYLVDAAIAYAPRLCSGPALSRRGPVPAVPALSRRCSAPARSTDTPGVPVGWLVLLVAGCAIAVGIHFGWSWALAASCAPAIILAGRAVRRMRRRTRRRTPRRLP